MASMADLASDNDAAIDELPPFPFKNFPFPRIWGNMLHDPNNADFVSDLQSFFQLWLREHCPRINKPADVNLEDSDKDSASDFRDWITTHCISELNSKDLDIYRRLQQWTYIRCKVRTLPQEEELQLINLTTFLTKDRLYYSNTNCIFCQIGAATICTCKTSVKYHFREFVELIPDLIDGAKMEALSPLSTNRQVLPRQDLDADTVKYVRQCAGLTEIPPANLAPAKERVEQEVRKESKQAKREVAKAKARREKEHPPEPPPWVYEPTTDTDGLTPCYKIGSFLGKGGFAICYKAELARGVQMLTGHDFALKVVKSQMSIKKMEEKFRTELQIHSKMRHPNIVEFHRAFTYKESTYIVLELCPNGSLTDMVKVRKYLTLPEVRRYTIQLCGAVKYMHHRNIIHRDLKLANLFLDENMNIKVGDFGLAAILMTEGEASHARRTTLCGTPNYIAPELLERGKGGHDFKVDLWSTGVIIFTMLTGTPPFQSTTQDEIYRKIRTIKWNWPTLERCGNDISKEAKALVSRLLVPAEDRPEPDELVNDPFFRPAFIPDIIHPSSRTTKPSWERNRPPGSQKALIKEYYAQWKKLCEECGVGKIDDQKSYPVVGDRPCKTMLKELEQEEKSHRTPIVPIPEDNVYTPMHVSKNWPSHLFEPAKAPHVIPVPSVRGVVIPPKDISTEIRDVISDARRAGAPSHAARLREQARRPAKTTRPKMTPPESRSETVQEPGKDLPEPKTSSHNSRQVAQNSQEIPYLNRYVTTRLPPAIEQSNRQTIPENVKLDLEEDVPQLVSVQDRQPGRVRSAVARLESAAVTQDKDGLQREKDPKAALKQEKGSREPIATSTVRMTRSRTAKNALLTEDSTTEPVVTRESIAIKRATKKPLRNARRIPPVFPEFRVGQTAEWVPHTDHQSLQIRLANLSQELHTATNLVGKPLSLTSIGKAEPLKSRPFVTKWVDYTNKFGVGYILSDGTIGCLFNSENDNPPTAIVVRGGESHLKQSKFVAATKREIVPQGGTPIEFYDIHEDHGVYSLFIKPEHFSLNIGQGGLADKIGLNGNETDDRHKKLVLLWAKFAKYMTSSLGKEDDSGSIDDEDETTKFIRPDVEPFIRFYQRLGDVGVWGFGDGTFQFNFPDHTKLVISNDGKWVDFYHLPVEAFPYFSKGDGTVPDHLLANRGILSYPLHVIVQGSWHNHHFEDIILSNQLILKLRYIHQLIITWLKGNGLGMISKNEKPLSDMQWGFCIEKLDWAMDNIGLKRGMFQSIDEKQLAKHFAALDTDRIKWPGLKEKKTRTDGKGEKLVWVSVGARGGDSRHVEDEGLLDKNRMLAGTLAGLWRDGPESASQLCVDLRIRALKLLLQTDYEGPAWKAQVQAKLDNCKPESYAKLDARLLTELLYGVSSKGRIPSTELSQFFRENFASTVQNERQL